jgi:hypothetical protein
MELVLVGSHCVMMSDGFIVSRLHVPDEGGV